MANQAFLKQLTKQIEELKVEGLYKKERVIATPQAAKIGLEGSSSKVLNFCANNYLGLAHHPDIEQAAIEGIHRFGFVPLQFVLFVELKQCTASLSRN